MIILIKICLKLKQLSRYMTILFSLSIVNSFASYTSCQTSLENIFNKRNKRFISLSRRFYKKADLDFFYDPKVLSKDKPKILFDIYLDKITNQLSESEKVKINELINNRRYASSIEYNGSYTTEKSNSEPILSLKLPIRLEDTYLEYSLIAHEVEHAVKQILAKREKISPDMYVHAISKDHHERVNFLDEMGAMSAEWLYLSAIPKSEIVILRRKLDTIIKQLGPNEVSLLNTMLDAGNNKLEDYLKLNWKNGRYNFKDMKQERIDIELNTGDLKTKEETYLLLFIGTGGSTSTYLLYKAFSDDEDETNK